MRSLLRRFLADRKGNIAILFAFAVVPIIGAMGAAVDYSMASAQRVTMQAAVDATALALAKIMPASQTELDARGMEWFKANMGQTPITNITLSISATTGKLHIEAAGYYQPEIISVLGAVAFPVGAKSEVMWGSTRLRVALVLDVTGSMASAGKMPAMQTAAKNLINQLKGVAVTTGDVYVSIVPFAKDVAVATSNYTANWVRWDDGVLTADTSWDALNGTCSKSTYTARSTCIAQGTCSLSSYTTPSTCTAAGTCSKSGYTTQATCIAAGTCSKSKYTTKSTCTSNNGTWTAAIWTGGAWSSATWTPKAHSTWNGCITDRVKDPVGTADYDTKNTAPNPLVSGTLFPAEQYASCPETVMGLSYDWTALTNKINALVAAGNTNQAIGLAWGWQTLTSAPFTIPTFDSAFQYKQVIILLSDGLNTEDHWYTSASSIDARQAITCTNVKNAGIILYTVQVNTSGDATSTVLKNCASDASKFFILTSGSQIITTFGQIATELANLHLSQ